MPFKIIHSGTSANTFRPAVHSDLASREKKKKRGSISIKSEPLPWSTGFERWYHHDEHQLKVFPLVLIGERSGGTPSSLDPFPLLLHSSYSYLQKREMHFQTRVTPVYNCKIPEMEKGHCSSDAIYSISCAACHGVPVM